MMPTGPISLELDPNVHDIPAVVEPEELFDLLHKGEIERIGRQVSFDYEAALMSHQPRMRRFRRYYQLWRNRADAPPAGEEYESNYQVPLIQWHVFAKWAQNLDSLFGDDAEITASPVGPSDGPTAKKVGTFVDWRVFDDMKLIKDFSVFEFRKLLFGRSFAYCPWKVKKYWVNDRDPATGAKVQREEVYYKGPGFYPQLPDDILVPAERAKSIQDFSFVIRKFKATIQDLVEGEQDKLYSGISDNFEKLLNAAQVDRELDHRGDEMKLEEQFIEGVDYDSTQSGERAGKLTVYEWYGRRRLPKKDRDDVLPDDFKKRNKLQTELRVYYLPDLDMVIGVDDLADLYPNTPNRRPFKEASMVKDGSYWCQGMGELLEELEDESSHVHRIFMTQGEMTAGPVIFAKPGSGFKKGETRYRPWTVITTEDPQGVNVMQTRADFSWPTAMSQALLGIAERVDGVTDQNLGRSIDRPNAPKTASGQLALIEQGNIRASLDTRNLREDFNEVVGWFWELETMFGDGDTFFRVTEEDAEGLYDVQGGGAHMAPEERAGRYDFCIKFATGHWAREANKERFLQLYGLLAQNPLVLQNPPLLAAATRELCKQLGQEQLAALIPTPSPSDLPKSPQEEWTLMLEGRHVEPNPADNDQFHLVDHERQLQQAQMAPHPDANAIQLLQAHVQKHQVQMLQKQMMAGVAQHVVKQLMATPGHGGNPAAGIDGGAPADNVGGPDVASA